jgi:hypothetical protein
MAAVRRMHDLGIDHRDLNAGNLLVRGAGAGAEAFVVDLDRARLSPEPLAFALRRRTLRRLERSWVKLHGAAPGDRTPDWIYEAYAGEDRTLGERLARGRRVGRWLIHLHRIAWRRPL